MIQGITTATVDVNNALTDNIYRLLLKNITRNDPFTSDEIVELKSFRRSITDDQWQKWLKFARIEKKRLNNNKNQKPSQLSENPISNHQEITNNRMMNASLSNNMTLGGVNANIDNLSNKPPIRITQNNVYTINRNGGERKVDANLADTGVSLHKGTLSRSRSSSAPTLRPSNHSSSTLNDNDNTKNDKPKYNISILPSPKQKDASINFKYDVSSPKINKFPATSSSSTANINIINTKSNDDYHRNTNIVHRTAIQLESACSAAEYLLNSFNENERGLQSSNNREITLSILSEMMNSIKKSKSAIAQLGGISNQSNNIFDNDIAIDESINASIPQKIQFKNFDEMLSNTIDLDTAEPNTTTHSNEDYNNHSIIHQQPQPFNSSFYSSDHRWTEEAEDFVHETYPAESEYDNLFSNSWDHRNFVHSNVHGSAVSNVQSLLFASESKNKQRELNIFADGQFNSLGYNWEGKRYEQGQDVVARLCLAQGTALWKAFDGYPIRVDPDSYIVDVIWRELRDTIRSASPESKKNKSSRKSTFHYSDKSKEVNSIPRKSNVLRRERFMFDDVFAGLHASDRMCLYMRQKTRKSLESARNMLVISLGCGETSEASLEPTVSVLLGNGGGTGIISNVIHEIFRYVKPLTLNLQSNPFKNTNEKYNGTIRSSSSANFAAVKVAQEQLTTRVLFSAVILSCGQIYDLLDSSSGPIKTDFVTLKKRKSDGKIVLHNASKLHLQTPSDFDRVMGLLIGKRTAMSKIIRTLHNYSTKFKGVSMVDSEFIVQNVIGSIDPWMGSNNAPWYKHNQSLRSNQSTHDNIFSSSSSVAAGQTITDSSLSTDSMIITISVTGGGVSKSRTSVDFNFVCPCGENWSKPGTDVNILTEIISSLPNSPPPSLLKASPLSLLLLDPHCATNTNFINLVQVYREENSNNRTKNTQVTTSSCSLVEGALHSLRIVSK